MNPARYIILRAGLAPNLAMEVEKYLAAGFTLAGGVACDSDAHMFYQAVYKPESQQPTKETEDAGVQTTEKA